MKSENKAPTVRVHIPEIRKHLEPVLMDNKMQELRKICAYLGTRPARTKKETVAKILDPSESFLSITVEICPGINSTFRGIAGMIGREIYKRTLDSSVFYNNMLSKTFPSGLKRIRPKRLARMAE